MRGRNEKGVTSEDEGTAKKWWAAFTECCGWGETPGEPRYAQSTSDGSRGRSPHLLPEGERFVLRFA